MPARILAKIADRQHRLVTREQLFAAGLTRSAITRWVKAGHLHRIHRGVYALGTPNPTREGRFLAAVLACGQGAVLSHESAAALWNLTPGCPPLIHVTVPGDSGRSKRRGIRIHRSRTLTPADTTRRKGVPVTTLARTLVDMGYGPERTRSDLERLFLRICRTHGIPKPEVNARVGPYEVDFLWRSERLVVEVDGWRYHSDRRAFETDRARDRELSSRGFTVLRFADRELSTDPSAVATSVDVHLRRRSRERSFNLNGGDAVSELR